MRAVVIVALIVLGQSLNVYGWATHQIGLQIVGFVLMLLVLPIIRNR